MAQLTLTEISKRFNVNRTTIYRAVSSGKLSRLNNGMFDLAEVIRVFGEPEPQKGSIAQPANNENDREIISILKSQVELLTAQLAQKDSQIDHLQRLLVAPETSQQHASATTCDNNHGSVKSWTKSIYEVSKPTRIYIRGLVGISQTLKALSLINLRYQHYMQRMM